MMNIKIDDIETFKSILTASLYDESSWRIVEGPMPADVTAGKPVRFLSAKLKQAMIRGLRKRGFVLMRPLPFEPERRMSGLDWPFFGYTMTGHKRMDNIEACVTSVLEDKIPGDFIETGVWRGGSVMLMKALLDKHGVTDRKVWCADSFEGLPPANATDREIDPMSDFSDRDFLSVSQEQVEANFKRFGLLDENVKFLKGWFCDTLPTAPVDQLAILRLDGDLYESTMDALTNLYPKLSPGGYLIIDDYASWAGCRKAIDEYRAEHGITAELQQIDNHAYFWRAPL